MPAVTIEDYLRLDMSDLPTELVRGQIVEHPFPTCLHGFVCARLICTLASHTRDVRSGWTAAYSGIVTSRNPDTVRGADASYYSLERLPRDANLDQYPHVLPEIVFEVKDRADSWPDITAKVAEYLHAGVDAVCVIDPEDAIAVVQTPHSPPRTLAAEDNLAFPQLLPGLSIRIADLLA